MEKIMIATIPPASQAATTAAAKPNNVQRQLHQEGNKELALTTESYSPTAAPATGSLLVKPIATADAVKASFDEFQKLKISLLDPKMDIQEYKDRDGNITRRIKKSGCKKIATAFGLDVQPINCETIERGGFLIVKYTVRAIAPNGRSTEAVGMCDTSEGLYANRKNHKLHDVDATAFTRAANRAVLDLVGGGEVSAEEVTGEEPLAGRQPIPQAWLDKLDTLVKDLTDGKKKLAEFVFEEIGARYLSKEEIVRVAEKLQNERAKVVAPTNLPTPGPAPVNDTTNSSTEIDPAIQERLHRAAWIEEAAQVQTVTPAGKWMSISGDKFDRASRVITGGRDIVEIAEIMGIEKFTLEAKRRFPGQLKNYEQELSAGLHVLAEWCKNHPAETIFPDVEGGAEGSDLFPDFDDDDQEYIK